MPSLGLYELQIGTGASSAPRPVGLSGGADDLGAHHAVRDLSKTNGDYEWRWQQQDPAADGAGSADVLPALGAVSMNRAAHNNIPPHQEYIGPNVPLGPQTQSYNLGYPNRQGEPHLAPQLGTANAEYYGRYSGQGVADVLGHNVLLGAHFDGYGASPLEVSEGAGSGGAGAFTSIGRVSGLNESELGPWTTSGVVAGQYGAQQELTDYAQGEQSSRSPYDLRALEYVEQDGVRGAFKFCHWCSLCLTIWFEVMPDLPHGSTAWTIQDGQSAPATMPAEVSISWGATGISDCHGQAYPSIYGGLPYCETYAKGAWMHPNAFNAMSTTGVAMGSPPHPSKEGLHYTPLNGTSVTLSPSNHQVTPATVLNATGNSTAATPAGALNPTEFSVRRMSKTRTGRNGPRRCLPGRPFERNLKKVQERLKSEGADVGAVERLRSEIFLDGEITKAALKTDMTLEQRSTRDGKQKYMLLLEVVPRPDSSRKESDHRCLLCPPWARAEFKNREDSLRHFHKDHFGLSFVCGHW